MAELKIPSDVGGTVVKIECAHGAALAQGDVILIVGSMKM
jgi:biotin carboxyl carrier protein